MGIRETKDGIAKDSSVYGDNVYIMNGQGCATVWYKNVHCARAIVNNLGRIPSGRDAKLCKVCQNHYSAFQKGYSKYPPMACVGYKKAIAQLAEVIFESNPGSAIHIGQDIKERSAITREIQKEMKSSGTGKRKG